LEELARYSVIVGYVAWFAGIRDFAPSVLDVGCGVGVLRERLERVPFSEYVGVDLSEAAIEAAQVKDHSRSRFLVGDFASLDLGTFDVVVLNEVLYYAPDARRFLAQVASALARDGLVLISMWRHPGDHVLWRVVDANLPIMDQVEVRNRSNPINKRGWLVSCSIMGDHEPRRSIS
jgi:2-polyprenyl-3-methyl-5-hydroxy-6-metoxy-1,4-benzoquinol methylase